MFASVGRHVLWLKRCAIGGLALDETLPEGGSRELTPGNGPRYGKSVNKFCIG